VECGVVESEVAAAAAAWAGHPFAATVALTGRHGVARQGGRAALLVAFPDRLHAELLDPLGTAQAVAIVNGRATATWSVASGWRRDAPVGPLPASLLVYLPRLLLGLPDGAATCVPGASPPRLVWEGVAEYRWDPGAGRLTEARLAGVTVHYRPTEPGGARSDARSDEGTTFHPPDLDITLGDGATVAVRWLELHGDPNLDPTLFTIPLPPPEVP